MTNNDLLPLAKFAADCYAPDVVWAWQDSAKLTHLLHRVEPDGRHEFAFAGTLELPEWQRDIDAVAVPCSQFPRLGDVHEGFLRGAWAAVEQFIGPTLSAAGWPAFRLVGHSKGAGECALASGMLMDLGLYPEVVLLLEPPNYGGAALEALHARVPTFVWVQTYNADGNDVITEVPSGWWWKRHGDPLRLRVPDSADIATKHKMPAVLASLAATLAG